MGNNMQLGFYRKFIKNHEAVKADCGGGDGLAKCYVMAYLARLKNLKNYVEIGVHGGKSLFSVGLAFKDNGGISYGIDPYTLNEAKEHDQGMVIEKNLNSYIEMMDCSDLYEQVMLMRKKLNMEDSVKILKKTSTEAVGYFVTKDIEIHMLHIDGNPDYEHMKSDFYNYLPLIAMDGFIVVDNTDWISVCKAYDEIKADYHLILEQDTFLVIQKKMNTMKSRNQSKNLSVKAKNVYERVLADAGGTHDKNRVPTVAVGVLAYNHANYISACLESIYIQKGEFLLKIIVSEDKSTDNTLAKIYEFMTKVKSDERIEIILLQSDENIGMVKNLQRISGMCQVYDYMALMDGDDYYVEENRINIHIECLRSAPECIMSFNSINMFYETQNIYTLFDLQQNLQKDILTTEELINDNFIGNISCAFYRCIGSSIFQEAFFEMFVGDWAYHIAYSQFGDIAFINKTMSVYRKHEKGIWGLVDVNERKKAMLVFIEDYNRYFSFTYDDAFSKIRRNLNLKSEDECMIKHDLVIIDDVFPHPKSGFRYQEYSSYLSEIESCKVFTTGGGLGCLGNESLEDLFYDYKNKYPRTSGMLEKYQEGLVFDAKLMYCDFLGNAYTYLDLAETRGIPFVFTLYPGGMFKLYDKRSDDMLKKVLQSRCFRKVIVTQRITYDYLLVKKFISPEKIAFIFGVVTPLEKISQDFLNKKYYTIDKNTLDICFVAHKYTKYGQDKGYDLFVEAAKLILKRHDNIFFHVVGPYDQSVLDVAEIVNHITFYGSQDQEWFDIFYQNMDIIMSPNISGLNGAGSFDGFPTASCTDAGLRKTAIFCTDELLLNDCYFEEGKEIVIIKHDTQDIVEKIDYYYKHPEQLKEIGTNGYLKIKNLYSYEKQLAPRLKILNDEILNPAMIKKKNISLGRRTIRGIRKYCPNSIKKMYKTIKKNCPQWLKDYYHRYR